MRKIGRELYLYISLQIHCICRFSQPGALRVKQGSDYLENQCESRQTRCDYTPQTRDQYLIYTDKSLQAFSDSSCRQACTQVTMAAFWWINEF